MSGRISSVVTETGDGMVATLSICNEGKLNAIDLTMWRQMRAQLADLAENAALRCLVVQGAGEQAFAAGGDLEEFLSARTNVDDAMAYHEEAVAPALNALAEFPTPVVACIQGPCIGGGLEIAACCDIRIAAERATFGAPILRLGFSMYAGELAHVLAAAGAAVTSEILLEGRLLNAQEAYTKGLLSRVVPNETLHDEVAACVRRIAQGAPLVARAHKQWIRALRSGGTPSLEQKRASLALVESQDYREGLAAFFAKRKPQFRAC